MGKGRKKVLSEEDISNIIEVLQIDDTVTKRDIVQRYQISLSTLYKYLPPFLKSYENFPQFKPKEVWNPGG